MTWVTPTTQTVGHIVTSTEWNGQLVGNLLERRTSVLGATPGGNIGVDATYTITASEAGNYIIEFGAGTIDTVSTGSTLQLASNKGGQVYYSDTGPGGGIGFVTGVALTASEVVTITCTSIAGSGAASLQQCWAKLTRTP